MKYVLYIIQILSTVIAAVSICAFVYFSARTHMAHRSAFILLSLFLFALTAVISGLATIICETIRDDKYRQQIFARIIRNIRELKGSPSMPGDTLQLQTKKINTLDEIRFQSLLETMQSLDLKLDKYAQDASDQSSVLSSTLSDLSKNITPDSQNVDKSMIQLADDINSIKNHIEKLETKIKNMTTAAHMADAFESPKYAKPQEEASYPEFVMNLTDQKSAEFSDYENKSTESPGDDNIDLSSDTSFEDEKIDLSSDTSFEDEKIDLSSDTSFEDEKIDLPSDTSFEDEKIDLPSDTSFEDEKIDLPSDTSFEDEKIDLPSDTSFEDENELSTGFSDLKDTSDNLTDDIASDRLKDIFNDQFASEIADLDILNDKEQSESDDIPSEPLTKDVNLNDFLK